MSAPSSNQPVHVPLAAQVGGHAGVMTTENGSLLIKPALPVEVNFYQSVASDPGFAPLRPFIPEFYGTLKLEGVVDQEKSAEGEGVTVKEVPGKDKESIVLENLSHSFLKPNILDIKLGTVLYDEDATPEKKTRMEKTAKETTSLETGVRLTGFQVYDLASGLTANARREYGKSIKASELIDGLSLFFPIASSASPPAPPPEPTEGETASPPETGTGLPPYILHPILQYLREDVAEIREALQRVDMRMVGASLLIIYEADWTSAQEGLKYLEEMHDKEQEEEGEEEDEEEEEEETEEEEEEDEEEAKKRPRPPYIVKLIDFAHTRIVPGQGPDKGVLKGVDTVLGLLDQRIEQVKAALP
ncbi:unnamed protein product [Somion occarium]|uniref:Kinase n=1 Tax=Somion occarium TaxID=3059160 RepID=A0ABP1D5S2_9APHY